MKNFVYLTYLNFICTSDMHEIEHIYIYEIQINTNDLLYRTWKLWIYITYEICLWGTVNVNML